MRFIRKGFWGQSGQMAVELAVVMPVVLVVAVIVLDALTFTAECARFDHVAAQAVLAQGASAAKDAYGLEQRADKVKAQIEENMGQTALNVRVTTQANSSAMIWKTCAFTCSFDMSPWPFRSADFEIAGVSIPARLTHEYVLVVEPYTPGAL